MFNNMKKFLTILLAALTLGAAAQTENPRGIYKLMTLTGNLGEIKAPFDQYKICTDSITLMVSVQNAFFAISNTDNHVLNYTGDKPKSEGDKGTLIYDSNADHFTLKWWSENPNHLYFPKNDWCIEKYESGQYSEMGRIAIEALMGKAETDAKNPLTGTWRLLGYVDEPRDMKKEVVADLREKNPKSRYFNSFIVMTPQKYILITAGRGGGIMNVEYYGKKGFKSNNITHEVKWLTKDIIAIDERQDYRIDWMVLERVTDGHTPFTAIASQSLKTW